MPERISDERLAKLQEIFEADWTVLRHPVDRDVALALHELQERRAADAPMRQFKEVIIDRLPVMVPMDWTDDDLARAIADSREPGDD